MRCRWIKAALALATAAGLLAGATAHAAPPTMTRDEIITIAKTGVGCPYVWGGTCWDPNNKKWKGADCSGYVTVCWQIPKASKSTDCLSHYYSTYHYTSQTTHWTKISRNELKKGDALVYRENGAGHIVIYVSGDKWGSAEVYEARGTAYGIIHRTKSVSSKYKAIRRKYLKTTPPPPPPNQLPRGELQQADCTALSGWAFDPDAKGTPIQVHLYVDGTPGQAGATQHKLTADLHNAKACTSAGNCKRGFKLSLPAALRDGKPHTVRAYGVDTKGGQNPELTSSPRTVTCAKPPPPKADGPLIGPDAAPPGQDQRPATAQDSQPNNLDLGGVPPRANSADPYNLAGGCAAAGAGSGWWILALLSLGLRARRRL